jgi:hypothetical protein
LAVNDNKGKSQLLWKIRADKEITFTLTVYNISLVVTRLPPKESYLLGG